MEDDSNIKEQLASLQRDTGRIEGKLDALIVTMSLNDKDIKNLETSVGKIKEKQSYHTGVAAALGTIGGYVATWFAHNFH